MATIPLKPHKGKPVYCIVDNRDGMVYGMRTKKGDADEALEPFKQIARVVKYVQAPEK